MIRSFILSTLAVSTSLMIVAPASFAAGESLSVRYGKVTEIEVTSKASAVARNALIGGIIGVAIDDSLSGALTGASTGFLITSIVEGDRRVYLYTLSMPDGATVAVAVKRPDMSVGHCVALEQSGKHNNLRPVSSVHCERQGTEEHQNYRLDVAARCQQAREMLSIGKDSQEIDKALHDLRTYCD